MGVLLQVFWWDIFLPRIVGRKFTRRGQIERYRRIAARFRSLAISMGGVMIKVGQFLSARMDVLPIAVTEELSGLQDEVRPEDFRAIKAVVEAEFGAPLESKYSVFVEKPVAAASIGQVHPAYLRSNREAVVSGTAPVVVKVQRPNIQSIVETDLAALQVVGRWLNAYQVIRRRANVPALLAEFSRALFEEMDYLHEGKNAEMFAANFANDPKVRVPVVEWSHTTRRVLTLENIPAIKITDYEAIEAAGIDRKEVASRLFDSYLKQIFEDGFFHADPHPGNLFILPDAGGAESGPREWKLVFVDFGMAGTISDQMMGSLRELLMAIGTRDSGRIVRAYQDMDILLPGADLDLLERAGERVFERFWGKSTQDMLKMSHKEALEFLNEFGSLLYEMPFQIPENIILLGRALAILMGICGGLDPEFNLWELGVPYAERLVASEGRKSIKPLLQEAGHSLISLVTLPGKLDRLVDRLEQGRLDVRSSSIRESLSRIERGQRRTAFAVVFVGFLLGAILFYLAGEQSLATTAGILAFVMLIGVLR